MYEMLLALYAHKYSSCTMLSLKTLFHPLGMSLTMASLPYQPTPSREEHSFTACPSSFSDPFGLGVWLSLQDETWGLVLAASTLFALLERFIWDPSQAKPLLSVSTGDVSILLSLSPRRVLGPDSQLALRSRHSFSVRGQRGYLRYLSLIKFCQEKVVALSSSKLHLFERLDVACTCNFGVTPCKYNKFW